MCSHSHKGRHKPKDPAPTAKTSRFAITTIGRKTADCRYHNTRPRAIRMAKWRSRMRIQILADVGDVQLPSRSTNNMRIQILDVGDGITLPSTTITTWCHLPVPRRIRPRIRLLPTQRRLRGGRETFQAFHLLTTHGGTQTHHRCNDPFRFNVDVVRLLSSRTVLIPFRRYPVNQGEVIHRSA